MGLSPRQRKRLKMINFYPAFWASGISVKISDDIKTVDAYLKLSWYNRNIVGTMFGGSLYAMCDPFFMLLLMENLGNGYIVWDKSATVVFKKPGRGTVRAHFFISEEKYRELREETGAKGKINPVFYVDVTDEDGEVVATVEKVMHIRKKSYNENGE
jgi:hypothetical protein